MLYFFLHINTDSLHIFSIVTWLNPSFHFNHSSFLEKGFLSSADEDGDHCVFSTIKAQFLGWQQSALFILLHPVGRHAREHKHTCTQTRDDVSSSAVKGTPPANRRRCRSRIQWSSRLHERSEPKRTVSIMLPAYWDQTHTCLPLLLGTATEKTQSPCCLYVCLWNRCTMGCS